MPQQYFINLRVSIAEEQFDLSYGILNSYPIQGIEEGHDQLLISFREEDWSDEFMTELLQTLQHAIPDIQFVSTERIEQRNWNEAWEQSLEPIYISDRIAITPSWHADSVTHEITIVVDPKMSFGTGYHPTTRMTTRLLEEHIRKGQTWIDAGTGTGVLSIAAVRLGAKQVLAFDNDEWSVENAHENIIRNDVSAQVDVQQADVFTIELPVVDGIVANMYRNVLIPVFPKLHEALRSVSSPLIISGILQYDEVEMINEAQKVGFIHRETQREDEWLAMLFERGA